MRLHEIREVDDAVEDLDLTSNQYKQIVADLKTKSVGDRRASAAKDMVMGMWEKGDKLVGNYKSVIDDFDIEI